MNVIGRLTYAVILITLLGGCKANKTQPRSPDFRDRYDLVNPDVIKLPEGLAEISGIVYYPKDSSVFAEIDEDGLLFKISLNNRDNIKKWRFDKKHDFEDIVLHDSIFYVLVSNGDIESVKFGKGDSIITKMSQFPGASKKKNEFESMYYDDSLRQLVVLCKSCEDDGHKIVSAWGYNIDSATYTPSIFTIDVQPIAQKLAEENMKLKPSAIAINPVTNEFYILCSVNKILVVTDREGKFEDLCKLDPVVYKQPEGIAFTPSGDLIISNESHETGLADILLIKNKKKGL